MCLPLKLLMTTWQAGGQAREMLAHGKVLDATCAVLHGRLQHSAKRTLIVPHFVGMQALAAPGTAPATHLCADVVGALAIGALAGAAAAVQAVHLAGPARGQLQLPQPRLGLQLEVAQVGHHDGVHLQGGGGIREGGLVGCVGIGAVGVALRQHAAAGLLRQA